LGQNVAQEYIDGVESQQVSVTGGEFGSWSEVAGQLYVAYDNTDLIAVSMDTDTANDEPMAVALAESVIKYSFRR
jgi:hypothetical protein